MAQHSPKQRSKYYSYIRPEPYALSAFSSKEDGDGAWLVGSGDTIEGKVDFYDGSLIYGGVTGALWSVSSPTGYYSDRWSKVYQVQTTGCFEVTGETGPSGTYRVSWEVALGNVTGIAHGQLYGVSVWAGETGHHTVETVLKVDDTIG